MIFHPATGVGADAVAQVQATLRKRILRAFVARGLLQSSDAKDMLAYQHSGFSVDAGVCIEAHDTPDRFPQQIQNLSLKSQFSFFRWFLHAAIVGKRKNDQAHTGVNNLLIKQKNINADEEGMYKYGSQPLLIVSTCRSKDLSKGFRKPFCALP